MNRFVVCLAVLALGAFGFSSQVLAQDPIVHTVAFPTGDAAWTVTFEPDPSSSNQSAKPPPGESKAKTRSEIVIVRKGNLRHDVVSWSDGTTTDYWWDGNPDSTGYPPNFVAYQENTSGRIVVAKGGNMGDYRLDGSFFTWAGADCFKGVKSFDGKECRYYAKQTVLPTGLKVTLRSWIDNKTAQPVAWSDNKETVCVFSFDTPIPPDPLVVPRPYLAEINRIKSFFVFPKRTN